jgi:hypothetical protein
MLFHNLFPLLEQNPIYELFRYIIQELIVVLLICFFVLMIELPIGFIIHATCSIKYTNTEI